MSGRVAVALAAAAVAAALGGCGSSKKDDAPAANAAQLTVYSSLPLQGAERDESLATINGEKLALSQVGGVVGAFTVKYVSMDDSKSDTGRWEPDVVSANAQRAVRDRTTIAYIGEADSGASAVAIPVLNESGILTVSPAATYPGLTTAEDADKGEPEKYYPSGQRTFARLVPPDSLQAEAQISLLKKARCTALYVIADRDVYGRGIAAGVETEADKAGIKIAGETSLRSGQTDFSDLAKDVVKTKADCAFAGLAMYDDPVSVFNAVSDQAPQVKLFGPNALARTLFASGLDTATARRTTLTSFADPITGTALAKAFAAQYRARYGQKPGASAYYGYEAMKSVLQAIRQAGNQANQRPEVLKQYFALRDRDSVIGRYSVSKDGDTSSGPYLVNTVRNGRLVPDGLAALEG